MVTTVEELEKYISDKWREYCAAEPKRTAIYQQRLPFEVWEAEFFMRGLNRGYFNVTGCDGIIAYPTLGGETKKNFFYPRRPGNCREAVTQFAVLTELIEAYRYPVENVLAESIKKGNSQRYALDALVFDHDRAEGGSVRIAIEAKCKAADIESLINTINGCVELAPHKPTDHVDPKLKCDHKKFQGLLDWRPAYLWAICPTRKEAYSVQYYGETRFLLDPVEDVPKFSANL